MVTMGTNNRTTCATLVQTNGFSIVMTPERGIGTNDFHVSFMSCCFLQISNLSKPTSFYYLCLIIKIGRILQNDLDVFCIYS